VEENKMEMQLSITKLVVPFSATTAL